MKERSHTDISARGSKSATFKNSTSEVLPLYRRRLYELFSHIDKEMEALYMENITLKSRLEGLEEHIASTSKISAVELNSRSMPLDDSIQSFSGEIQSDSVHSYKNYKKKLQSRQLKWKTAFRRPSGKLAVLKSSGNLEASSKNRLIRFFKGHNDVIWDVSAVLMGSSKHFILSASADQTAKIWQVDDGDSVIVNYTGHCGSVNSISPHPDTNNQCLTVLTTSGDKSAHIFKVSGDDLSVKAFTDRKDLVQTQQIHQPNIRLVGHYDVVCDGKWLAEGNQIITASWDRTSNIYDVEEGKVLKTLTGHDDRIVCCSTHPSQKLVATSSKDCTFRLWDFRETIQSVAVFQGHNETVTSCVFSSQHHIVSASDDRTAKVWDLRNMRSPIVAIRLDSSINKIAISSTNLISIPQDNRHISVYTLQGTRLARISRVGEKGHEKMVCSCAWLNDHPSINLLTCSLDKKIIGWGIQTPPSL